MGKDGTSDPRRGYTTASHPSDIDQAVFLGDVRIDNLHAAFMALAAELWSVRRRQKVVETLLATRGVVTAQMIETFIPSAAQETEWHRDRDQFIRAVYDPLQRREGIAYHSSLHSAPVGTGG